MRSFRTAGAAILRPKVTPDPQAAAALARKLSELAYTPEIGFHRDRRQARKPRGQS